MDFSTRGMRLNNAWRNGVNYLVTGQPLPGERPKGVPDLSANASEANA